MGPRAFTVFILAGVLMLIATVIVAISLGPVNLAPSVVWDIVLANVVGLGDPVSSAEAIVWKIRAPRTMLAVVVGAGLSLVGVAMQALVRNPLADPYLLGISSGAGLGAVMVIVSGGLAIIGSMWLGGFLGALLAFVLVYAFAQRGGTVSPLRLVLAGVAIAYVLSGATTWLVLRADQDKVLPALFWLQGSLAGAGWEDIGLPAAVVVAAGVVVFGTARRLNGLVMGDETAASVGVSVAGMRLLLYVVSSLTVAVLVATSGGIAFVGLMVPHAVRFLVGTDHRRVIPATMICGAAFLVAVDAVSRLAVAPGELPISVVTSIIGAPLFLLLMRRREPMATAA